MITKETENFILYKFTKDKIYTIYRKIEYSPAIKIADIIYAPEFANCYLRICGSSLQDYIVSWQLFTEFISLVDEAFDDLKKIED